MLLTAYSDRDLLLQAIQLGKVHDYVLKPWRAEELGVRLRALLDGFKRPGSTGTRRTRAGFAARRGARARPVGDWSASMGAFLR